MRHLFRWGATLALGTLLLAGCGGPPAGGDPGGRRLKELATDGVFSALPRGATLIHTTRTRAAYQEPGFSGGGWRGPSVVLDMKSAASAASVFRFYGARASATGWRPLGVGSIGLTDSWTKTYRDGAKATLLLSRIGARYVLSGGVAPARR